jgi:hypothetical protein
MSFWFSEGWCHSGIEGDCSTSANTMCCEGKRYHSTKARPLKIIMFQAEADLSSQASSLGCCIMNYWFCSNAGYSQRLLVRPLDVGFP